MVCISTPCLLGMRVPVPQISQFSHHQAAVNCFGGEFREAHEGEWVGLMNHMLHFITDLLQLPDVPALLQFVYLNADPWPAYDVPFQEDIKNLWICFNGLMVLKCSSTK